MWHRTSRCPFFLCIFVQWFHQLKLSFNSLRCVWQKSVDHTWMSVSEFSVLFPWSVIPPPAAAHYRDCGFTLQVWKEVLCIFQVCSLLLWLFWSLWIFMIFMINLSVIKTSKKKKKSLLQIWLGLHWLYRSLEDNAKSVISYSLITWYFLSFI